MQFKKQIFFKKIEIKNKVEIYSFFLFYRWLKQLKEVRGFSAEGKKTY